MKHATRNNVLRVVALVLALAAALWVISVPFTVDTAFSKTTVQGLLAQPEDSLQAVYIGNSGVYRFFQPALAWGSSGVAVMNLATASMPGVATKNLMKRVSETQDVELFIVDLRAFTDSELNEANLHNIIDFMPPDGLRFQLVTRLCVYQHYWPFEALEYYFPVLRFHSRFTELEAEDLQPGGDDDTKGSYSSNEFLRNSQTEHDSFALAETTTRPQARAIRAFDGLLDYCDKNDITVLFVAAPLLEHKNQKERLAWFSERARARGYEALNFNEQELFESTGIALSEFMDNTHTNIYGSEKFTLFVAEYLKDNYGLTDLRGTAGYESWGTAYENYRAEIGEAPCAALDELLSDNE